MKNKNQILKFGGEIQFVIVNRWTVFSFDLIWESFCLGFKIFISCEFGSILDDILTFSFIFKSASSKFIEITIHWGHSTIFYLETLPNAESNSIF